MIYERCDLCGKIVGCEYFQIHMGMDNPPSLWKKIVGYFEAKGNICFDCKIKLSKFFGEIEKRFGKRFPKYPAGD